VSHHAEQDHSGALGAILREWPHVEVLASPKGVGFLRDHLELPAGARLRGVEDEERVSLGDRTLKFFHTPWVHWPETMVTWVEEESALFPGDLFGSHLAAGGRLASDEPSVMDEALRYYATIMMPFASFIRKHLDRLAPLEPAWILPTHGPAWDHPSTILDAHRRWSSGRVAPKVVLAWVSMHGSTRALVSRLEGCLAERGIPFESYDLASSDLGAIAGACVDADTLVLASPMVLAGPHPVALHTAHVLNLLKPPLRHIAVVGSFGWGGKLTEHLLEAMPRIKAEVLEAVIVKGLPRDDGWAAIARLADDISSRIHPPVS